MEGIGGNAAGERLLGREEAFTFRCDPQVPCFTRCCRDVNIFLGPYDIARLRSRLGISSGEFLQRYTLTLIPEASGFPLVILKMEGADRLCPFVGPQGCTVYEDRPWSCRMYPLDKAEKEGYYRFVAPRELCHGGVDGPKISVSMYLESQGLEEYERVERRLRACGPEPQLLREPITNPRIQEMCRMAMYDLDRFRRFVLESRFLELFYIDHLDTGRIRTDDLALMELAHKWLRFGLVEGDTLRIREEAVTPQAKGGKDVPGPRR